MSQLVKYILVGIFFSTFIFYSTIKQQQTIYFLTSTIISLVDLIFLNNETVNIIIL